MDNAVVLSFKFDLDLQGDAVVLVLSDFEAILLLIGVYFIFIEVSKA